MLGKTFIAKAAAALLFAAGTIAATGVAEAAMTLPNTGIYLTKAAHEANQTVIQGKTKAPGQKVTLDSPAKTVTSSGTGAFTIKTAIVLGDCVVVLKVGTKTDTVKLSSCGPSGPVDQSGAMKRTIFETVEVPTSAIAGAPFEILDLAFKAPSGGVALVSARGFCSVQSRTDSDVAIHWFPGIAGETTYQAGGISGIGVIRIMQDTSARWHQQEFSVERAIPVTKGQTYDLGLMVYRTAGTLASNQCSGAMTVQFFPTTLP